MSSQKTHDHQKKLQYSTILVDIDGPVALVTLNRPETLNTITIQLNQELGHALFSLDDDESVRAIVVTGAGRAFCAGGAVTPSGHPADNDTRPVGPTMSTLASWKLGTPILAAINGAAVGGITFALQWDIRIAAEDAKIGFVFTNRGVCPEANATWLLSRAIGSSRALELLLTGRVITGTEAAEYGLVSRALPRDKVLPATLALAHEIASRAAPAALAVTKKMFYEFLESGDRRGAWLHGREAYNWLSTTDDAREGFTSFLEKRPAALDDIEASSSGIMG